MSVLEFEQVSYCYDKGKMILENLQQKFERGKIYAILGPSGCGKTTALSLLGGLDVPTQGKILFEGEDILNRGLEHHRREHVSFVFQNYNLIDYMTPEENVKLTADQEAIPILERVGLSKEECRRNVLKNNTFFFFICIYNT